MAAAWPAGHSVPLLADSQGLYPSDSVAHVGDATFRVVSVPLILSDGTTVGSLYLATNLDRPFAQELGELAHAEIAIVSDGHVVASTMGGRDAAEFEKGVPLLTAGGGTLDFLGESHAYRRLFAVGDTAFYALTSIDEAARAAVRDTTSPLFFIGIGAVGLALLASIWIAHRLSEPIGRLSSSLHRMAT